MAIVLGNMLVKIWEHGGFCNVMEKTEMILLT